MTSKMKRKCCPVTSQYRAGGQVCHCHRLNSWPNIIGGRDTCGAAGDKWGAVSLCSQGPGRRQRALLYLNCLSLPRQCFLLGLLPISTPSLQAVIQGSAAQIVLQSFLTFPWLLCAGVEEQPSMQQPKTPATRIPDDMHQQEDSRDEKTLSQ